MGFRKTECGNVIYEFDFTPTKLVPMSESETGGSYDHYRVEGPNGERAPIEFEYQGERYKNYGCVFCSFKDENGNSGLAVTANIALVATLAKLLQDYEDNYDEKTGSSTSPEPWSASTLAKKGVIFDILSLEEAKEFMAKNGIPRQGFDVLRERIS